MSFLTKTDTHIVLVSPDTDTLMGTSDGKYVAIYDGTEGEILTEIEFDVAIDSPDCQNLRMIVPSNSLIAMSIMLGDPTLYNQSVPSIEDEHGLWEMGFCHAVIKLTINGVSVPFLTLETADDIYSEASKIVLKSPMNNNMLGTFTTKVTTYLTKDDHVLLEQTFPITLTEPKCDELQLSKFMIDDMEIKFGYPGTEIQTIPTLTDAAGANIFEMGYCAHYFLLCEFGTSKLIPYVTLEGSE